MSVAVVVLTFNEARRLRPCLESVRWADELIVVDGFSTDSTVEVAAEFTGRIYQSDLLGPKNPGGFSAQRNFALGKVTAQWVLFLDADERCSPDLAEEIARLVKNGVPDDVTAFEIRRKEFYFGVHTAYTHGSGWLPRLLRSSRVRWNDRMVHEGIETPGRIDRLQGMILHESKDSIADYLATQNRYTSLEADELMSHSRPLARHPLYESFRTFCNVYIYKGAYREGAFGLIMSGFFASYTFQIWAKHWEQEMKAGKLAPDCPRFRLLEGFAALLRHVWVSLRPPRDLRGYPPSA